MANGDLSSSSGFFTPVSSGAEYRLGYDAINALADKAAAAAGASPWIGSNGFVLDSRWGPMLDGNGSSAFANGGLKPLGPFKIYLSFQVTFKGATTITASSSGDINPNLPVFQISNGSYRPFAFRWISMFSSTQRGSLRIGTDGWGYLCDMNPGGTIATNDVWYVEGEFLR